MICPTCDQEKERFHNHHILPRSLGGTDKESNLIFLCEECHSKIHSKEFLKTGNLISEGLKKAKAKGIRVGRPPHPYKNLIIKFRKENPRYSYQDIATLLNVAKSTVCKTLKEANLNYPSIKHLPSPYIPYGEESSLSKLKNTQVKEIYLSKDTRKNLSIKYQVSRSTIDNIRRGLTWKHITRDLQRDE